MPQILLGCVEGSQGNMAAFPGSLALIDGGSGQSTLVPNANGLLHVEWCVVLFCLKGFCFNSLSGLQSENRRLDWGSPYLMDLCPCT